MKYWRTCGGGGVCARVFVVVVVFGSSHRETEKKSRRKILCRWKRSVNSNNSQAELWQSRRQKMLQSAGRQVAELNRKCQEARLANRKFLTQVTRPKVYSVKDTESDEVEDGRDSDKAALLALLDKSLRQFENEEVKRERKNFHASAEGDSVAQATYVKELHSLSKDTEKSTTETRLDSLMENLNARAKERYTVKKKQLKKFQDTNNPNFSDYINEKNKKFNQHLQKQNPEP